MSEAPDSVTYDSGKPLVNSWARQNSGENLLLKGQIRA